VVKERSGNDPCIHVSLQSEDASLRLSQHGQGRRLRHRDSANAHEILRALDKLTFIGSPRTAAKTSSSTISPTHANSASSSPPTIATDESYSSQSTTEAVLRLFGARDGVAPRAEVAPSQSGYNTVGVVQLDEVPVRQGPATMARYWSRLWWSSAIERRSGQRQVRLRAEADEPRRRCALGNNSK
jgi:hypothetical protein